MTGCRSRRQGSKAAGWLTGDWSRQRGTLYQNAGATAQPQAWRERCRSPQTSSTAVVVATARGITATRLAA